MQEKSVTVRIGNLTAVFSDSFQSEGGEPTYIRERHFHADYEFQYIISEDFCLEGDGFKTDVKRGEAVIVPPFFAHRFVGGDGTGRFHLRLSLEKRGGSGIGFYEKLRSVLSRVKRPAVLNGETVIILSALSAGMWDPSDEGSARTNALLKLLLLSLEKSIPENGDGSPVAIGKASAFSNRIEHVFSESFSENISLGELASRVGISQRQLQRVCQQSFGRTCGEMLGELRLTAACRLVSDEGASLRDAAYAVGYETYDGFYKAFLKRYGKPPYKFLKENKKA